MSKKYSYNFILINYDNNTSNIENILSNEKIEYYIHDTEKEQIKAENIIDPLFPSNLYDHYNLWINLYQESNKDFWIILENNIYYIDFDNLKELINWINDNYGMFDIINLSCNFICNDKFNKIAINDKLYLSKNIFNLSLNGYIISKTFLKNFINLLKTNYNNINISPNLLLNLHNYGSFKYYNINPYLIKYNDNSYNFNSIYNRYKDYFMNDNSHKDIKIIYYICLILILLINYYLIQNIFLYILCVYVIIYLLM